MKYARKIKVLIMPLSDAFKLNKANSFFQGMRPNFNLSQIRVAQKICNTRSAALCMFLTQPHFKS